jgi:hypothetical protein
MSENIIWKRMIYHGEDLGDYYLVSNTGEVKNAKTNQIRKKSIGEKGYYQICLSIGSRQKKICIKVHRAVAETFLDNTNNYPVINHKDTNKLNNNIDNLEFCTYAYNVQHAIANKLTTYNPVKYKIQTVCGSLTFDSITEAGTYFNKENPENGRKNISRALSRDGMAYGYKWMYI